MTLLTLSTKCQINNPIAIPIINSKDSMIFMKSRSAGDELQIGSMHFYEGVIFTAVGSGLLYTSQTQTDTKHLLVGFGGAITLVGVVLIIESHIHYKKAGIILNQNGVGVTIKLN